MEKYMTVKDVAAFVQLSIPTIRRLTWKKQIPFYKINSSVRYKPVEIQAWVETRKQGKKQSKKQEEKQVESSLFENTGGEA